MAIRSFLGVILIKRLAESPEIRHGRFCPQKRMLNSFGGMKITHQHVDYKGEAEV
jgi:hypothetical protein